MASETGASRRGAPWLRLFAAAVIIFLLLVSAPFLAIAILVAVFQLLELKIETWGLVAVVAGGLALEGGLILALRTLSDRNFSLKRSLSMVVLVASGLALLVRHIPEYLGGAR